MRIFLKNKSSYIIIQKCLWCQKKKIYIYTHKVDGDWYHDFVIFVILYTYIVKSLFSFLIIIKKGSYISCTIHNSKYTSLYMYITVLK